MELAIFSDFVRSKPDIAALGDYFPFQKKMIGPGGMVPTAQVNLNRILAVALFASNQRLWDYVMEQTRTGVLTSN
jgi:hypothetical protein